MFSKLDICKLAFDLRVHMIYCYLYINFQDKTGLVVYFLPLVYIINNAIKNLLVDDKNTLVDNSTE